MKSRPIHENLDTSFVNLPALIRYLRRRQFAGRVRVELSGYEADIDLTSENQMRVREYDQIAGRVAEGDEALQRILIRSREPGGIINVYQTIAEVEAVPPVKQEPEIEIAASPVLTQAAVAAAPAVGDLFTNGNHVEAAPFEPALPTKPALPNLPFEFTNKVEEKAKAKQLSAEERKVLLGLMGELLGTADRALSMAKLNFPSAYHKSCMEICADYPFLMSLEYGKGKISVPDLPSSNIFVAGTLEALRRILDKLGRHPKFGEVHRFASQQIMSLANQRSSYYTKYGITSQLKKVLGI